MKSNGVQVLQPRAHWNKQLSSSFRKLSTEVLRNFKLYLALSTGVHSSWLPAGSPGGGWAAHVCTAAERSGSEPAAGRTESVKHWLHWVEWPISWAGSHQQTPSQVTVKARHVFMRTLFSQLILIASFSQQQYKLYEEIPCVRINKSRSKEAKHPAGAKIWRHWSRRND